MHIGRLLVFFDVLLVVIPHFSAGNFGLALNLDPDQFEAKNLFAQVFPVGRQIHPLLLQGRLQLLAGQIVLVLYILNRSLDIIIGHLQAQFLDTLPDQFFLDQLVEQLPPHFILFGRVEIFAARVEGQCLLKGCFELIGRDDRVVDDCRHLADHFGVSIASGKQDNKYQ